MRIWTTQSISFWEQLQTQGIVYCDTEKSFWAEEFKEAYDWMANQT